MGFRQNYGGGGPILMKKQWKNLTHNPSWDELKGFTDAIGAKMAMDRQIYDDVFFQSPESKIPDFLFSYFGDIKWSEELPRMCSLCREIVSPATLIVDSWLYLFCPDCHYCFGSYEITGESVPVSSEF